MSISFEVAKAFGKEIDRKIASQLSAKDEKTSHLAEVLRVDNNGNAWVHIYGGANETPVYNSSVTVSKGDMVNVSIDKGAASIDGNLSSPAITTEYAEKYVEIKYEELFANVKELVAEKATIQNLTAMQAQIIELLAHYAYIENGIITNAQIDQADVRDLSANYAKVDFANMRTVTIDQAAIINLLAQSGIFENLVLRDGAVTGELSAVSLNGDLVKANTLVADRIIYPGANGMYYMLNYHGGYSPVISTMEMDPAASNCYELVDGVYVATQDTVAYIHRETVVPEGGNPSALGYYELFGGSYVLTQDTEVQYSYSTIVPSSDDDPSALGYYELSDGSYVLTEDTVPEAGKDYYVRTAKKYYVRILNGKQYYAKTESDLPLTQAQYQSALDGSRIVARSITTNELNVDNITATGNAFMNNIQARLLEAGKVRVGSNDGMHILISSEGNQPELGFYNGSDFLYREVVPASGANPKALGYFELVNGSYVLTEDTAVVSGKKYYWTVRNESARVAYIDGRELMIPYSVVLNQMKLGEWAWTYRRNGNMDLVYIGSED